MGERLDLAWKEDGKEVRESERERGRKLLLDTKGDQR